MDKNELKPCPICGEKVEKWETKSPDGSILWIRIMHQPTIGCGISFIDDASVGVSNWNTRVHEVKNTLEELQIIDNQNKP